jgi:hypothetical protein
MDWQPIETAPKDGTRFDVWLRHPGGDRRVINAWFSVVEKEFVSPDGYYLYSMKPYGSDHWLQYPTHWMPLPEPPKQAQPAAPPNEAGA